MRNRILLVGAIACALYALLALSTASYNGSLSGASNSVDDHLRRLGVRRKGLAPISLQKVVDVEGSQPPQATLLSEAASATFSKGIQIAPLALQKPTAVVPSSSPSSVPSSSATPPSTSPSAAGAGPAAPVAPFRPFRALIFTMDSLTAYIEGAARGGPAGEILIRESLQRQLMSLGASKIDVAAGDEQFFALTATDAQVNAYDLIFLDPWTVVGPGWVPRPFIAGRERKVFVLSFFGLTEVGYGTRVETRHVLTAFPVHAGNSFLGYAAQPWWAGTYTGQASAPRLLTAADDGVADAVLSALPRLPAKLRRGVVWGKNEDYFAGKWPALASLAVEHRVQLHFTLPYQPADAQTALAEARSAALRAAQQQREGVPAAAAGAQAPALGSMPRQPQQRQLAQAQTLGEAQAHGRGKAQQEEAEAEEEEEALFIFHGHLSREEWRALLGSSRFMLGLGDPLSGPSAVDAVACGAVFLNPLYAEPKQTFFMSQHPFLHDSVGAPYVCSFSWDRPASLSECTGTALTAGGATGLPPFIPPQLTPAAYAARVRGIIAPALQQ